MFNKKDIVIRKKNIFKLSALTKIVKKVKQNPYLIKKGVVYLRANGIKDTLLKVRHSLVSHDMFVESESLHRDFVALPLTNQTKENTLKIAVVVHAFYIDILEDILSSIDNIVPKPDLYISVSQDANIDEIKAFLAERGYDRVTIKGVPNRGRDVAPFLVEFGENLRSYDLCCKIHGKKSLYTGSEQSQWRNHIYTNLLGSTVIVNDIINAFMEDKKLGLVFSDSKNMIPYWGYTWLTNKPAMLKLLDKLNLLHLSSILNLTYIDFPAGTMFWFRPNAIKQLLSTPFKYEDFPEEPIANDGTIAHALERLLGFLPRYNGYEFIELNYASGFYTRDVCHKNFNQLEYKNKGDIKHFILHSEYIIFDIFDTLVTRTLFYPDNLFRILEHKIDQKFGIQSNFFRIRKETENHLRGKLSTGKDVTYSSIYDAMSEFSNYSETIIAFAREYEYGYELDVLKGKSEVLDVLRFAQEHEKKILFVSDMYLEKSQIISILRDRLSIDLKHVELYISSDTGYRKDNDSIWHYLIENKIIDPDKTIMIGDNEVSDAKKPGDVRIRHIYHLLSEKTSFFESPIGKVFKKEFGHVDEIDMALLGPAINTLFASPFMARERILNLNVKLTPYEFGYVALAPFIYLFMNHIYNRYRDKKMYFLSRDGYFLKEIFEHFLETKDLITDKKCDYLLVSRRALLGAVEHDISTLKNVMLELGEYQGNFSKLIYDRMGLEKDFLKKSGIKDFDIFDRNGLIKGYEILSERIETINAYNRNERENMMMYLDKIEFFNEKHPVVIDLGYSGTIQHYLHRLSKTPLIGEYFVTTEKVSRIESDHNHIHGFFANKIDPYAKNNPIYNYALILEAYLTSDKGQLLHFDSNGNPVFKENPADISIQREITEGIRAYIDDMSIYDSDFFNAKIEKHISLSQFMFAYTVNNRYFDDRLKSLFFLEDDFTGNSTLNILDILDCREL